MNIDLSNTSELSPADKLRIVTQLWDEIAAGPGLLNLPVAVLDDVMRREAELDADPTLAIDDEELWRRIDG